MTFATRLTKVRDRSEHFDERTGMCYHQAPPSERVVMHVRDAEQAKPHLEHNPLSLLGACYATPRRKLNDPATVLRTLDSAHLPAWEVTAAWPENAGLGDALFLVSVALLFVAASCYTGTSYRLKWRCTHRHFPS